MTGQPAPDRRRTCGRLRQRHLQQQPPHLAPIVTDKLSSHVADPLGIPRWITDPYDATIESQWFARPRRAI